MGLAETGQLPHAQADLAWALRTRPNDIFWQSIRGPEVKASIALAENKPAEAIAALEATRPYDRCTFDGTLPPMLRATAYLAAGQFAQAEQEFRKVLEHPYVDPLSANVALAHLGLARAQARQGRSLESRQQYQAFFAAFQNADPDLPVLKHARDEYAHIPAG